MNIQNEFEKYALKEKGISSLKLYDFKNFFEKGTKNITPYILEERKMNVTQMDVFSRLMNDRIIFFNEQVDDNSMGIINAQCLFLSSLSDKEDIKIYINSPGGGVISGCSLVDVMNFLPNDFETTTMGMAASMGSVIASNGTKGKRGILKHSRFMIHNVSSGTQGTLIDMEISLELTKQLRDELFLILAENSGNSVKQISKWCERDKWFTGKEAVENGFVDYVLEGTRKVK